MSRRRAVCVLLLAVGCGSRCASIASAQELTNSLPDRALFRLGDERLHHRSFIQALAFSPDGRCLAAASTNQERGVRLWDAATGNQTERLVADGPEWGWVQAIAFSPDGKLLLAGDIRGRAVLWNVEQHAALRAYESASRQTVHTVAFSPDGTLLALGDEGGEVRVHLVDRSADPLWVYSDQPARAPGGFGTPGSGATALLFTPDGAELIVGFGMSARVLVLNAETGKPARMIPRAHGPGSGNSFNPALRSLALTPDGTHLITFGQRTDRKEDLPPEFARSAKNVTLSEIFAWQMASGAVVRDLMNDRIVQSFGYGVLSPDGSLIACGCFERLELIDAQTGAVKRTMQVPGWYGGQPVFSPDGSKVAAGVDNVIALWDVTTGERLLADQPGHAEGVGAVSWSADGQFLATTGYDGTIRVWESETGRHAWGDALAPDSNIYEAAFSADGRAIAACGLKDWTSRPPRGIAKVWSAQGALLGEIDFAPDGRGQAVAPDGARIVVAHSHGGIGDTRLELWQVKPPQKLGEFPRDPAKGVSQHKTMHFSPDGRFVHIAEYDGTVTRWDTTPAAEDRSFVADWRPLEQRTRKNSLWLGNARFSSDAELLVTSTNETLCLWDVAAGTLNGTITVPEAPHGFTIGLSPDGRTLAAAEIIYAGAPGTDVIRIFDLETRQVVLTLSPEDARASSFAFSPDGKRLLSGFDNGTTIVWDVSR